MHSGANQLVVCKTDVLQHRRLVEELGACWRVNPGAAAGGGAKAGGGRIGPTVEEQRPCGCRTGAGPSVGQQLKNPGVNSNN